MGTQASNKGSFAIVKQLSLITWNLFQLASPFQQFAIKWSENNSQECMLEADYISIIFLRLDTKNEVYNIR